MDGNLSFFTRPIGVLPLTTIFPLTLFSVLNLYLFGSVWLCSVNYSIEGLKGRKVNGKLPRNEPSRSKARYL